MSDAITKDKGRSSVNLNFCYFAFSAQAVDQLISKEKELQAAIEKVQEQQARQQEIQTVREEISKKDREILNLESQLKEAEKMLVGKDTGVKK